MGTPSTTKATHHQTLPSSIPVIARCRAAGAILGSALDDFVGAVLAKKTDKGFLEQVWPMSSWWGRVPASSMRMDASGRPSGVGIPCSLFVALLPGQVDREFLDTEIRALKEKLKQYERESLDMNTNNSDLHGQLVKQKDDQKDIFQYLNGEECGGVCELRRRRQERWCGVYWGMSGNGAA